MLRLFIKNVRNSYSTLVKDFSTVSRIEKWDIYAAVCLERKPIIISEMNELEQQFNKQLTEIELENSHKSEHELRHEQDLKQLEQIKAGDLDVVLKQTAQDFADANLEELNKFKAVNLKQKPVETTNLKSTKRKLKNHLVFVMEQQIGDKLIYLAPQSARLDGETLRQTADRVLNQTAGMYLKAQILGNAPVGFYKYKYPKSVNDAIGAKVFFYFARFVKGELPQKINYKWLDREEIQKELPTKYYNSLRQFLIHE